MEKLYRLLDMEIWYWRKMMNKSNFSVFINCPFDKKYLAMFNCLVFTIHDCGFIARCSKEIDDSGQIRLDKISDLIKDCKYGIHDLSRTELDRKSKLPRFNMPLELGVFLGAKRYGAGNNKNKCCLILDKEQYRYQRFISDIAGQDIKSHNDNIKTLVTKVRDWLKTNSNSRNTLIPSGSIIYNRYKVFQKELPSLCRRMQLRESELVFNDYVELVLGWLKVNELEA